MYRVLGHNFGNYLPRLLGGGLEFLSELEFGFQVLSLELLISPTGEGSRFLFFDEGLGLLLLVPDFFLGASRLPEELELLLRLLLPLLLLLLLLLRRDLRF